MKLKPSLLWNSSLCIHPFTFVTEELRLVATARYFIYVLLWLVRHQAWHLCLVCSVSKATPIHFIDSKCHIKRLKARKRCKTCLTNYIQPILHHIMPLVIMPSGADTQTDRHKHTDRWTKMISRSQKIFKPGMHGQRPCAPRLKYSWLKNHPQNIKAIR